MTPVRAWGIVGFRGYVIGEQVAPNGVNFNPFFSLDLNFNLWLCRSHGVYLFNHARFWGQKPGPRITNPTQGPFDFGKPRARFQSRPGLELLGSLGGTLLRLLG